MNKMDASTYTFFSEDAHRGFVQEFLPLPFRSATLNDYPATSDQHRVAHEAATRFVQGVRFDGLRSPFVIYGSSSSHKTHLACCIWRAIAPFVPCRCEHSDVVDCRTADNFVFVTGQELMSRLNGDDGDAQFAHHATAFFAVLDDLDQFPAGTWSSLLLDFLNKRLCVNNVPTVVTMNLSPRGFVQRYGANGDLIIKRFERMGGTFVRLDPIDSQKAQKERAPEPTSSPPPPILDMGDVPDEPLFPNQDSPSQLQSQVSSASQPPSSPLTYGHDDAVDDGLDVSAAKEPPRQPQRSIPDEDDISTQWAAWDSNEETLRGIDADTEEDDLPYYSM